MYSLPWFSFSITQVRRTIEKELGKPMNDLFADFVLDPLATASVSTKHFSDGMNFNYLMEIHSMLMSAIMNI
jgi:hypothetical protein